MLVLPLTSQPKLSRPDFYLWMELVPFQNAGFVYIADMTSKPTERTGERTWNRMGVMVGRVRIQTDGEV